MKNRNYPHLIFHSLKANGNHNFLMDWDKKEKPKTKTNEILYKSHSKNWHIIRYDDLSLEEYLEELRERNADPLQRVFLQVNGDVLLYQPIEE